MNDLPFHLLLFFIGGSVIVVISALFAETEDIDALAILPRRLLYFFAGCATVAVVMLILEHTLASIH
jgi:hypothetical protein